MDADGKVTALSDVLPFGDLVPSEPGTLFLKTQVLDASGNLWEHRLLQVSCKLADVDVAR